MMSKTKTSNSLSMKKRQDCCEKQGHPWHKNSLGCLHHLFCACSEKEKFSLCKNHLSWDLLSLMSSPSNSACLRLKHKHGSAKQTLLEHGSIAGKHETLRCQPCAFVASLSLYFGWFISACCALSWKLENTPLCCWKGKEKQRHRHGRKSCVDLFWTFFVACVTWWDCLEMCDRHGGMYMVGSGRKGRHGRKNVSKRHSISCVSCQSPPHSEKTTLSCLISCVMKKNRSAGGGSLFGKTYSSASEEKEKRKPSEKWTFLRQKKEKVSS